MNNALGKYQTADAVGIQPSAFGDVSSRLGLLLQEASVLLDQVNERFSGVLQPVNHLDKGTGQAVPVPVRAPITDMAHDWCASVSSLNGRMQSLIQRCEL